MKKYITPAVEVHNVLPQDMMAVSFGVSDAETTEQLSKETSEDWNLWDE